MDYETEQPAGLTAVTQTSKSGLPGGLRTIAADPEQTQSILQKMQQMVAEREGPMNTFISGLKDASAWGAGGAEGPTQALVARDRQKAAEAKELFDMRTQMAALKTAEQQNKVMQNVMFGAPGTATPSPTTAGQAQTMPLSAVNQANQQSGGLLNLVADPGLRQQIAAQFFMPDGSAKAMTQLNTYLAKRAEEPALAKEVRYMIEKGLIDPKMIAPAVLTRFIGSGAFVPHATFGVGGEGRSTPISSAIQMSPGSPNISVPGTTPSVNAPAAVPPPAATGAPAPAATGPSGAAAGPKPIAQVQPLPKVGGATPTSASTIEAPLVSPSLQTGFTPGSVSDIKMKEKSAEQAIQTGAETQKPIAKQVGESIAATKSAASNAPNNIQEYDMAESVLRRYPKAFGIGQDGSATAAIIQLVKPGTTIPILGTVKSEGIEEAIAQKRLPPDALAARATFDAIATRQGVEFAKNNLTGEGRGTLSNADLKMAGVAKGLSINSPAATNLIFTILNRENEQMILDRGRLIEKFEKESRERGVQPNYSVLRESDAWKKTMSDKEERVKKRFPEFFKGGETEGTTGKLSPKDFIRK